MEACHTISPRLPRQDGRCHHHMIDHLHAASATLSSLGTPNVTSHLLIPALLTLVPCFHVPSFACIRNVFGHRHGFGWLVGAALHQREYLIYKFYDQLMFCFCPFASLRTRHLHAISCSPPLFLNMSRSPFGVFSRFSKCRGCLFGVACK